MRVSYRQLTTAFSLIALLFAASSSTEAQTRKRTPAKKRPAAKRPAPPPEPVASGVGLEPRLASLLNSSVATNSKASVVIAEVETGKVVAQRNPEMPVAPASNMKLFTTAAALDLLGSDFEFVTSVS